MNTTTTPPFYKPQTLKVIFKYDEAKFARTMHRMTEELLSKVKVSVWAPQSNGKFINLLSTNLAGEAFDEVAKNAAYTIYEGSSTDLYKLGVA